MPDTTNQYLAWGGESDGDGFTLITAEEIRKDWESSHYSGYRMWEHFALIDDSGDEVRLRPVTVVSVHGSRQVDDQDYVHEDYSIVYAGSDDSGKVVEGFGTRIDGRA
jgi:hypothetical protein